jgi:hypothetical protein
LVNEISLTKAEASFKEYALPASILDSAAF